MEQLGRVNLLVGTNNCGKTSVLEAISILMEQGTLNAFRQSLSRRGETYDGQHGTEFEISHLFHGHSLLPGACFTIAGLNDTSSRRLEAVILERDPQQIPLPNLRRSSDKDDDPSYSSLDLVLTWIRDSATSQKLQCQITSRGGFYSAAALRLPRPEPAVLFVTTEALNSDHVQLLLQDMMLTPEEDTVLTALRTIEPDIERVAPLGSSGGHSRGGVVVKLAGQRVPIGSLGDGIWRLLGIALALVRARGGVLLVDEIDTGLHYSVLERMWQLVRETATRLDVQVFATTHSRDCYESLAAIAQPGGHDVTIQRIERGKPVAVTFSEDAILQVAKRDIEVR